MIQIPNLTPLQREICDRIWATDSREELLAWIDTLPRNLLPTVWSMIHMILAETIDQEDLGDMEQAREVIDRIRNA